MKYTYHLLLACFLISLNACEQNTHQNSSRKTEKSENNVSRIKKTGTYLKFKTHEIIDKEGTGMIAFTCLIPEGWTVKERLYWEYNDATLPIRYQGSFKDAKSELHIMFYPDVRAVYSIGPTGASGYPAPRGAIQGLKELIKHERRGIQYTILAKKILNKKTPTSNAQGAGYFESHSESAMIKIGYTENSHPIEEEFYGQLDVANSLSQGVVTLQSTIWSANNMYSLKAEKSKLENCRKIAQTIKASSRPTMAFFNKYTQVVQLLSDAVYQKIYQAGQISKIISQTNDQISKSISDTYWKTQSTYARTNNQFSNAIRGVEQYNDGTEIPVQLPSGYDNAWVNNRGEYLLSESNGFDPNTTLTGNWKSLKKQ